jgi:hypothetical protein
MEEQSAGEQHPTGRAKPFALSPLLSLSLLFSLSLSLSLSLLFSLFSIDGCCLSTLRLRLTSSRLAAVPKTWRNLDWRTTRNDISLAVSAIWRGKGGAKGAQPRGTGRSQAR